MSDKKSNGISILAKPKNTRSSKKKTKKLKSAEINRENVSTSKAHDFWSSIDNKTNTVRLNLDIPVTLNEKLSAKAKTLQKTKSEIVRKLIEWALDK